MTHASAFREEARLMMGIPWPAYFVSYHLARARHMVVTAIEGGENSIGRLDLIAAQAIRHVAGLG
jgi:hypothetical protein